MITRLINAGLRAIVIAMLIATPAMLLPGVSPDSAQIVALMALLGAIMTFTEYASVFPSFVEFRDAPPFNRLRYFALAAMILLVSALCVNVSHPNNAGNVLAGLSQMLGRLLDFPFSPVRLFVLALPVDAPIRQIDVTRAAAALSLLVAMLTLLCFYVTVYIFNWPLRGGSFNFWVNLPLFDPTQGADILPRLKRDASFNLILGFLLPFLIPALLKLASTLFSPVSMADPQTLTWMVSAWAFLPLSLMMRGIALIRIAVLIEEKRRRAYARAEAPHVA